MNTLIPWTAASISAAGPSRSTVLNSIWSSSFNSFGGFPARWRITSLILPSLADEARDLAAAEPTPPLVPIRPTVCTMMIRVSSLLDLCSRSQMWDQRVFGNARISYDEPQGACLVAKLHLCIYNGAQLSAYQCALWRVLGA